MRIEEDLSNQRNIYSNTGGRQINKLHFEKGAKEGINRRIWVVGVAVALFLSLIPIIVEIIPTVEAPAVLEVDDSGGKPYTSIQAAVDDAQPGDTVFVYAGMYDEDVIIDKTLNLTGENRDTTIINASAIGILIQNVDYVNISGFTIENGTTAGIRLIPSNNSIVYDNRIERNEYGIQVINSNNTIVKNNVASNSSGNYHGIYLSQSTNITIENNICTNNNFGNGIRLQESPFNYVANNTLYNNDDGIQITFGSDYVRLHNNTINSNTNYGIWIDDSEGSLFTSSFLKNNDKGIYYSWNSKDNKLINTTIIDSVTYDIGVRWNSHVKVLNTTFDKSKTYYNTIDSTIIIQWYIHINVIDYLGNPVSNANVKIEDNLNGLYNQTFYTDSNGHLKWLPVTEYIEQDTTGDTIGEKLYFTPHKIIAWNNTLAGYVFPEPIINESKIVTIVLYNGTLLDLESGWNLISLPRIQIDTNLQKVLQSIEGRYNSVQWYNITDNNDPWKHHYISKPPFMNDLHKLNHTKGFWLHIIDSEGTILVVIGNELISDQKISIYPGWNLIGYPSKSNKTRDVALDNLFYGSDIDSIWTFNSTIQKWIELYETTDYFEIGKGYWIHSRVTKIWNVSL